MNSSVTFECKSGSTEYAIHMNADRMWRFLEALYVAMADFQGGVYEMQNERIVEVYKECGLWNPLTNAPLGVDCGLAEDVRKKRADARETIRQIIESKP